MSKMALRAIIQTIRKWTVVSSQQVFSPITIYIRVIEPQTHAREALLDLDSILDAQKRSIVAAARGYTWFQGSWILSASLVTKVSCLYCVISTLLPCIHFLTKLSCSLQLLQCYNIIIIVTSVLWIYWALSCEKFKPCTTHSEQPWLQKLHDDTLW